MQPDVGLVAGGEDERRLGAHPVGELLLELDVERDRAVEQAGAGERRAVGVEGIPGRPLDPLVAGQAEVVVGAEHDRLPALHLDDRPGLRGEHAEVGQHVALTGELELLGAIVVASLGEDVGLDPGGTGKLFAHTAESGTVRSPGAVAERRVGPCGRTRCRRRRDRGAGR